MAPAVINIRPDETGNLRLVRLLQRNPETAYDAFHERVLLCAPRDVDGAGYIGTAMLMDLRPDCVDRRFMVAELDDIILFPEPIKLTDPTGTPHELGAIGADGKLAFHHYGLGVRALSETEFASIIAASAESAVVRAHGFGEVAQAPLDEFEADRKKIFEQQAIRDARLRMEVLQHYGPVCAVSGDSHGVEETASYEVEICHIRAVKWGGVDEVWNAMPMTRTLHWAYDLLLFSMTNGGELLFSPRMQPSLRERFNGRTRVTFPEDPRAWPKAECIEYHCKKFLEG